MNKSQLAINSVSNLPHPVEAVLDAYAEVGFANVEFCLKHIWDYIDAGHSISDARTLLDERKLHCIGGFEIALECFSAKRDRARNHRRILQNAELLAALGGVSLVVGTDGPGQRKSQDPVDAIARVMAEVADAIAHTEVNLLIEFNWSPIVKSFRTAADIARKANRKNVGVLFDPAHYHCTPSKFEQLTKQNVRTIKHVHVNDMRDIPGEFSDSNDDRLLPGKGCLDLVSLFKAIEEGGYNGYFSIEMFDEDLWKMPPRKAARLMHASMEKLCMACA